MMLVTVWGSMRVCTSAGDKQRTQVLQGRHWCGQNSAVGLTPLHTCMHHLRSKVRGGGQAAARG